MRELGRTNGMLTRVIKVIDRKKIWMVIPFSKRRIPGPHRFPKGVRTTKFDFECVLI